MNTAKFRENRIQNWAGQGCAGKVVDILSYASPTHNSAQINMLSDSTKLSKINISTSRCDRVVRVLINQTIREPNGWFSLPRGSIKPSTTIEKCKKFGCEE